MSNSGNSGGNGNSVHVLVFPFPAQGHMLPLLDLTHQLALHSSLAITILVTPKNKTLLTPLLSKHPSIQTLILPFPNHPSIPLGVENVKDLSAQGVVPMICALSQLYDPLLRWFQSHPSPPAAIISDFFLGWTNHLACHIGIPRIVFSPSGLATLSLSNSMWRDLPKIDDPNDPNFPISFPKVPNSPTFLWWQVSTVYRRYVEGHPDSEFIRDNFLANIASWGIVFNSFFELESVYFAHMRKDLGHHRVWAVGPLLPPGDDPTTERGGSSSVAAGDVISWLDRRRDNSVVYICFGSQAVLTNKQMEAVAAGLEQGGSEFVWCIKEATTMQAAGEYGVIPSGFEERVEGRGLVLRGWAPQVLILRHPAVGAFLTHCGWNSVLEALVAGVPMLAWPMGADQFINARLLVEEIGVAVKVCEGPETVPNPTELAKSINESVGEERAERVRARAMQLRKAALEATKGGGTSSNDLDGLVNYLCALQF